MFRPVLVLACLLTLSACDSATAPANPVRESVITPDDRSNRHGVRGVLRWVVEDPEHEWQLELQSGAMIRLLGGPLETFRGLVDREVFIVGLYNESGLTVETVDEDSKIYHEYNLRPARK